MRLSLHMMVLNGASTVERALSPLRGIVNEVVAVDTGSTDGTKDVILGLAGRLGMDCKVIQLSPSTHPSEYFLDVPSSYKRRPLSTSYTGGYLLRDWASARNLSLGLCTGDYVLKVDADDEVVTPGDLLPTLELMEKHQNLDIVMSPYETMSTPNGASLAPEHTSLYTRLWRHSDAIRFAEVCHENIDHARQPDGSNWLIAHNGLVVCDWRDSTNPRAPHRNYKILLREYERLMEENELPSRHLLFYLGEEGIEPDPMFVITVLLPLIGSEERDLGLSLEDRIWSYLIEGRCWSKMEHVNLATSAFEQAVLLGSSRALLLLGMLRFKAKMDGWRADLENSLGVCERKMWPFGASRTEIETARSMLCPRASKD